MNSSRRHEGHRGGGPQLPQMGRRGSGTEGTDGLVSVGAKRGSQSALVTSVFSLDDSSRSAKEVGKDEDSGDQLGKGLGGIKCVTNAARG